MENQEENNFNEPVDSVCDKATKPASSPIPAGYSSLSYPKCDTATKTWYWFDPQVAPPEE